MGLIGLRTLPNIITGMRLVAVPVVIWLVLTDRMTAAFCVFVAAGVSDAVDGYLAKRFNARTVLGSYLDPLADKLLLVAIYVLMGRAGHIPLWLVMLVIMRDAALLGGSVLLVRADRTAAMRPLLISKLNTLLQIVLAAVVLARLGVGFPPAGPWQDILVYTVAATTVISAFAYLIRMGTGNPSTAPGRTDGGGAGG